MSWITDRPWPRIGMEVVPPTLLIALGHPWVGAGLMGGALVVSAFQSWLVVRSAQERQRAILSYAQDATSMGTNPAPVIAALRGTVHGEDESPAGPLEHDGPAGVPLWRHPSTS
jgi:hypothetical protein